jgi:Ca-activated chloride channel family protein
MQPEIETHVHRPYIQSGGTLSTQVDIDPGSASETASSHVAICLDTSRSMNKEDKLEKAKDALTTWVFGLLDEADRVSVVAFDSEAEVVMESTRWGDVDRSAAEKRIESLEAKGSTDMYGALELAAEELTNARETGLAAKRILLLSDGEQNSPDLSVGEFERLAERIDDQGIRIRAGGIGSEYRVETIKALGTTGRGKWLHVQKPRAIREFFGTAVEDAQTVIGTDAEVRFDFREGIEVSKLFRAKPQVQPVEMEWEGGTGVVKLPDLVERESQKLAVELHVPGDSSGPVTLADVELRSRGKTRATATLDVTYTDDEGVLAERNDHVDLHLQRTRIRSKLGDGDIEAAETILGETKIEHEPTAVRGIEKEVTRVKEDGGRKSRNEPTIVDENR